MGCLFTLILMSGQLVGSNFTYSVSTGDSLASIGARFGADKRVIVEMNGLTESEKLRPGQELQIDNRHIVPETSRMDIVINLPQRMLYYFAEGQLSQYHPIAAGGRGWQTPSGEFKVQTREENPVWDVPLSIQAEMKLQGKPVLTHVPPSRKNPLGKYWMGLSLPGIGIHGTNAASSIYSLRTHGCIRLHPDDMRQLFDAVQVGTPVRIIYEPVLLTRLGDTVFLEVHPDTYGKGGSALERVREVAEAGGFSNMLDWAFVEEVIGKQEGLARDVTLRPSDQ